MWEPQQWKVIFFSLVSSVVFSKSYSLVSGVVLTTSSSLVSSVVFPTSSSLVSSVVFPDFASKISTMVDTLSKSSKEKQGQIALKMSEELERIGKGIDSVENEAVNTAEVFTNVKLHSFRV